MDFTLSEELTMIRDMARDFVTNELLPIERDVLVREKGGTRGAPIPAEKRAGLKKMAVEQGLWAMTAPEALGGGGLSTLGACLVAEELGKTFVDFDFGDVSPVLFEANAEQQAAFLAPAIAGEMECVLALSEPGRDAADDFATQATPDGDGWRLTGRKVAGEAELYLVMAQTTAGPTCFVVERTGPGVVTQDGELRLEGAAVPAGNVLGQVGGGAALGIKYASARMVRAAARKVGIACRLLEMTGAYARDWKVLGQALAVRPAVQRQLAEMAVEIDAARWLVYRAANELDEGRGSKDDAVRASLFAAGMVRAVIDRSITVYGGPAHTEDLPMLRIYMAQVNTASNERILEWQRFQVANGFFSQ